MAAAGGGGGLGLLIKSPNWPLVAIVLAILLWSGFAVLIGTRVEFTKHRTGANGTTTTTRKSVAFRRDPQIAPGTDAFRP
ncbi:MAG TPA: hypothetical protein VNQ77_07530 [Frankiaceae bacterium]|nr:hypothetical protein [Frankiaceae bacterium]